MLHPSAGGSGDFGIQQGCISICCDFSSSLSVRFPGGISDGVTRFFNSPKDTIYNTANTN